MITALITLAVLALLIPIPLHLMIATNLILIFTKGPVKKRLPYNPNRGAAPKLKTEEELKICEDYKAEMTYLQMAEKHSGLNSQGHLASIRKRHGVKSRRELFLAKGAK